MKKILSFFAALLMTVAANATVWSITPGHCHEGDRSDCNLYVTLDRGAQAGDTIVLADGEYIETISFPLNNNVVVMAAEGAKPVVKQSGYFKVKASAKFEGIKFQFVGDEGNGYCMYFYNNSAKYLELENCEFQDFTQYCVSSWEAYHIDSCIVNNCYFHDCAKGPFYFAPSSLPNDTNACDYLKVTNTTFANISLPGYVAVIDIRNNNNNELATSKLRVDHCTFYNCKGYERMIQSYKSPDSHITNCIMMNPLANDETPDIYASYLYGAGAVDHCLWYQTKRLYSKSGVVADTINADPLFVDAANGDFHLGTGSPALTAATDGGAIGDPRWFPAALEPKTYYGATSFTTEGTVIDPAIWTAVEWNITRNADKTLTFEISWTADVTGMVAQINLDGNYNTMTLNGKKATYTTTATYEDGAALTGAFFYLPYAGAAKRIDIAYTVGAENEKPETPVLRMQGTYRVGGENADYATLSAAATAIRTTGMSGDVTLLICADITEVANVGLVNTTDYTITIRPDAATKRTIDFNTVPDNVGPSGHIMIGYDMEAWASTDTKNVIIDGSFNGEGQYLEILGGTIGGVEVVYYGYVTNSVVKNCRLISPRTSNTTYVVHFRSEKGSNKAPTGVGFENCYMQVTGVANAQAVYFNGSQSASAAGKPKDCYVKNCEIVSNLRGIFFNGAINAVFEGNTFRFPNASGGFLAHGIMGNAQSGVIEVRNNKFIEMGSANASAGAYGMQTITASGGSDVWVIENNYFAGMDSKGASEGKSIVLTYVRCGDSCVVRHNTFYMPSLTHKPGTAQVAAQAISCVWLAGDKAYPVENNIFVSAETEAYNSLIRGAVNANVKNNAFYHSGGNCAIVAGAAVAADWAAFTADGANAGSAWVEPSFVDAANGDLALAAGNNALLMPRIAAVMTDIEGTDRGEQTYAGAFEYVPDMGPIAETYFAYTVTETIAKNTETAATGGTIMFGADKFETPASAGVLGYKLDGNPSETGTKYVLCKLNRALAAGDVITISGFATSNPKDGQAFQVSLDRAGTQVVGSAATTVANTVETLDIPVNAAAVGATEFYITRVSASVYFTAVEVHAGTTTGFDNMEQEVKVEKFFRNGQVYIKRDGVIYTVTGVRVK